MNYLLSFVPTIKPRGEESIDPKAIDWQKLRGQHVRIVYERPEDLKALLRPAMAHDCSIDVLDFRNIDYGMVVYDTSGHRRVRKLLGLKPNQPTTEYMPPRYALWLLKDYERANRTA